MLLKLGFIMFLLGTIFSSGFGTRFGDVTEETPVHPVLFITYFSLEGKNLHTQRLAVCVESLPEPHLRHT